MPEIKNTYNVPPLGRTIAKTDKKPLNVVPLGHRSNSNRRAIDLIEAEERDFACAPTELATIQVAEVKKQAHLVSLFSRARASMVITFFTAAATIAPILFPNNNKQENLITQPSPDEETNHSNASEANPEQTKETLKDPVIQPENSKESKPVDTPESNVQPKEKKEKEGKKRKWKINKKGGKKRKKI